MAINEVGSHGHVTEKARQFLESLPQEGGDWDCGIVVVSGGFTEGGAQQVVVYDTSNDCLSQVPNPESYDNKGHISGTVAIYALVSALIGICQEHRHPSRQTLVQVHDYVLEKMEGAGNA